MNKLISLLEYTENKRKLYYIFIPIFYLFEVICFFYFWRKIKYEMLTNEPIVSFLHKNEFGYKWYKLYKADIIEHDDFLYQFTVEEMAVKIKAEFISELLRLFKENIAFDIENYLNVHVDTEILPNNSLKKYSVTIKYYRYFLVKKNFKFLLLWLAIVAVISFLLINVNLSGYKF